MATLLTDNGFDFNYDLGGRLTSLYTTGTMSSWYYWVNFTVDGGVWGVDQYLNLDGNFLLDAEYKPVGGTITQIWDWSMAYGSHYQVKDIHYDFNLFDAQIRAGNTAAIRETLFAGNDIMRAAGFYNSDYPWHVSLYGLGGHDTLYGHSGQDTLDGGSGNDMLVGRDGMDQLIGRGGNDSLNGGANADRMAGGAGDDTYYVDNIGDTVSEWAGQGYDTVRSSLTHTLSNNVEKFVATGTAVLDGTGNGLNNVMTGNGAANRLNGEAGNDRLWGTAGNDALSGGGGNDWLVGGMGRDTLIGGLGRDVFDFNSGSESPASGNRDVINDFTAGDRIDLSGIDADASQVGNQVFTSLGTGALFPGTFAMAGELYYDATSQILHGNTDADAQADFSIRVQLSGLATLILADLAL